MSTSIIIKQLSPCICIIALLGLMCAAAPSAVANETSYTVLATHAHRSDAFTQGLLTFDGQLFESSGHYGRSHLARLQAGSASHVEQSYSLPKKYFAEGAALFGGRLYLLTWKAGLCVLLNPDTLEATHTLKYQGEGWGLTSNQSELVMSNGSDTLSFRDPSTFKTLRELKVHEHGQSIARLNELEWARGLVYANVWYSDHIIAIDPRSGDVVQRVDLSALRETAGPKAEALNGIAYNPSSDTFFVTGKYWSQLYEIKLPQPTGQ